MQVASILQKNIIGYGVAYGAIASVVNILFLVPVYGQLAFHLGQAFVFLCFLTRGLPTALIAGSIASVSLAYSIDNSAFIFLMLAELITVAWLYNKRIVMLFANILFWLLIGIPISYLLVKASTNFPLDYTLLLLIKQLLNGALYTLLATTMLVFVPLSWCKDGVRPHTMPLGSRIFYLSMVSTVLPALLVAMVFTSRSVSNFSLQTAAEVKETSRGTVSLIDTYIDTHKAVVRNVAENIVYSQDPQTYLLQTQQNFDGFITMLMTDTQGYIVAGAPDKFYQRLETHIRPVSVSDRDYYRVPLESGEDFISSVFMGRGFGNDPIVAVSSPIIENGDFIGVVEGSLNLPKLRFFEEQTYVVKDEHLVILTDAENKVVYASTSLPFTQLQVFSPKTEDNVYTDQLKITRIDNREYLIYTATGQYGWKAHTVVRPSILTSMFMQNIVILLIVLSVLSFIFLLVSRRFSRQLTTPIRTLIKKFSAGERDLSPDDSLYLTEEVVNIAQELNHTRDIIVDYNEKLQRDVEEKTAELVALNAQLEALALKDALTELSNRRHFDDQAEKVFNVNMRNKITTTIVAIDIDHFKRINDTFGHPTGDQCIKFLAKALSQHFTRKSDILARYGGEEFILLLSGGDAKGHVNKLETFRKYIQTHPFTDNHTDIHFTVSLGAMCVTTNYRTSFNDAMREADALLYQSKQNGRNQITHKME
ncbi:diguanylate cyclase [Aestuariibacter sp. AA17]|uniref:diguanylate cyclase n=1 Tax=Fluctibacter corallii TaxID=2984329 RepID=A0ABT3A4V3_9ALTE|nr:diguanylate cyclase [Aestuariibacter sp. AA17]MCV2883688.1 diguanylate cyclase [Aestuariibacter sp. AA17]